MIVNKSFGSISATQISFKTTASKQARIAKRDSIDKKASPPQHLLQLNHLFDTELAAYEN